jgi:heparosan-N-sulfate-glucuronate 5-epimerase
VAFRMFVDAEGIPYSDYGVYGGLHIGRQRSILAVAERGLWYWNEFLRGEEPPVLLSYDWTRWPENSGEFRPSGEDEAGRMLVRCSDWLLASIRRCDGFSVWAYSYPFSYGTAPGWRSAHAQAVGAQLLVRTAEITGDAAYVAPLGDLVAAFPVDVGDGGLSTRTEGGNLWFEKMADAGNQQPKVLNGLLFSVIGLMDVGERAPSPAATELAGRGVEAALELLHEFDLGDWSAYDIHGRRASPHYHAIHIRQLAILSAVDREFAACRARFEAYAESARSRRLGRTEDAGA